MSRLTVRAGGGYIPKEGVAEWQVIRKCGMMEDEEEGQGDCTYCKHGKLEPSAFPCNGCIHNAVNNFEPM